jgi:hypothetical protein
MMPDERDQIISFNIQRGSLDERAAREAEALIEAHISRLLPSFAEGFDEEAGFAALRQDTDELRRAALQAAHVFQIPRYPVLNLNINPGFQLLGPPYDASWNVGSGMPFSALDGTPIVYGGDGFSASGFGVNFTSDRHMLVSVVPHGPFTGGWGNLGPSVRLRSRGGAGTAVFVNSDLLLHREPRLWDVSNPGPFTGISLDLPLAAAATPAAAGSFGPVPLAPVLFEIRPGDRCLVWFYTWLLNQGTSGQNFLSFAQAKVPLLTVAAGPPVAID